MPLSTVYLGLGSNIDRQTHLCAGLDALDNLVTDLRCSPVFESSAVGIRSGPFYNLVVRARTALPLAELSLRLKHIEADNGRYAPERKGLPLDIDVLLYDDLVGDFAGLLLPRAEVLKNAFVLWPLALLAPELLHPTEARSFAELWQDAQIAQELHPVAFRWRDRDLTPQALLEAFPA